ncbi:PEP-CTERM protein-sorting domain-containing protein [Nitrosomonas sp. Nm51]|uniref:FxDxF family PEP-CTERM protein n=1 Tax=Nitrosomonas sp. Nm51 TaxID=133720 RepID=UPI0008C0A7DD|nr:FxDxF family PEP-CTERM protein [Nitrosomonas sp. Nm51]SER48270.1 PEP-CTERM protein-sorting domain-containing protein [Nitrosomonas sp. Nm51]
MKSLVNIAGAVTLAIWLGLSGSIAKASTPGPIDSDFVLNTSSYNANFGNDSITGSFVDHFTFTTDALMTGSGGLSIISGFGVSGFGLNIPGFEVIFDSFGLWDVTDNANPFLVAPGTLVNGQFAGFSSFPNLTGDHDYDLIVSGDLGAGHSSGAYSGNISIAPIPEPKFYIMLLVGLALVGIAVRRRQNSINQSAYA